MDQVHDSHNVLGLSAGDPSLVREQPAPFIFDIVDVLRERALTVAKGEYASALAALVAKLNPYLFSTNCIIMY